MVKRGALALAVFGIGTALAIAMPSSAAPSAGQTVQAATTMYSGTWGTVNWTIDSDWTLHLGAGTGASYVTTNTTVNPWAAYNANIVKVAVEGKVVLPASVNTLFGVQPVSAGQTTTAWQKLTSITGLENMDTSNVTSMAYMFAGTPVQTISGLAGWDVSKVASMMFMFNKLPNLTQLDLSAWNTGNVTNSSNLFNGDTALTSVGDLSNWNMAKNTNMGYMFTSTSALRSIGSLASWNVGKVTNMQSMFYATGITDLGALDAWDVSNVTSMTFMFSATPNLIHIGDLSTWQMGNVVNPGYMFQNAAALQDIGHLDNWNVSSMITMQSMFQGSGLVDLGNLANWNTSKVTNTTAMFANMPNLTTIGNIGQWQTGQLTSAQMMFQNAAKLTSLNFNGWNTASLTAGRITNIFAGMTSLNQITFGPQFTLQPALPNATTTTHWLSVGTGTDAAPEGLIDLTTVAGTTATSAYTGVNPDTYVLTSLEATATITFVDDDGGGTIVGTPTTVSGLPGATMPYAVTVPTNYVLASGSLTGNIVLTRDDSDNVVIHLKHGISGNTTITGLPTDFTYPDNMTKNTIYREFTRTITVTAPDGTITTTTQLITYFCYVRYDLVTHAIVKNSDSYWHVSAGIDATGNLIAGGAHPTGDGSNDGSWPAFTPPAIPGYKVVGSDGSTSAPQKTVNAKTGASTTLAYHYEALPGTATITYIDENGDPVGNPVTVNGLVGTAVSYTPVLPAGYDFVNAGDAAAKSIIISADTSDNLTIRIEKWVSQFPATGSSSRLVMQGISVAVLGVGAVGLALGARRKRHDAK